jgi:LuxR family transcriptional regulator, maltose regulon positive regulatory protein
MLNLLTTKLRRPPLPLKRVARPQLIQRLNEGLEDGRQLTLFSAPAGFGKTLCACEWLQGLDEPLAWLSLEPADDEAGRFFTYLVAVLQAVDPDLGRQIEGVLSSGMPPPVDTISTALDKDLSAQKGRIILALDDFQHLQDPAILQVISSLVANPPPALHLVLLTREDPPLPLARLRAYNRMTEVRAADLRFKMPEVGAFMKEVMGLALAETELAALEERTEGWAAGLQLAGLSMRGRGDPAGFIHSLRGSQRNILSYLTEEVLNQQSQAIEQFLLDTSILDRLSGELCDELTGRSDSASLLEQLYHANLFLIPLDDEQRWYRYHHLFADLLRHRQSASQGERTAGLHQGASRWYDRVTQISGTGERAYLAGQAIQHALAAADYANAVRLIENHAAEIMNQWYVKTVQGWLQKLPPEWSLQSPRTNLAFAHLHLVRGDFAQAAPYLERLESMFAQPVTPEREETFSPAVTAEWLALKATLLNAQGMPEASLELARQALDLTAPDDLQTLSRALLAQATAYQQLDEPERAERAYQQVIQAGQAAGNLMIELLGISALGLMLIVSGRQREGFDLALGGVERVERAGMLPPIVAGLYGEVGSVCFNWGQLEKAEHYFRLAKQASAQGGFSDSAIYFAVARSRICQLRGDLEGASREIEAALQGMRSDSPVVVREQVIAQHVNILLAQGNPAAAWQTLSHTIGSSQGEKDLPLIEPGQKIAYPQGVLYNSVLRIRLYEARSQTDRVEAAQALDYARRLLETYLRRRYIPLAIETLLLRAQLHYVLDDFVAGNSDLETALELAGPEGHTSVFALEGQPITRQLGLMLEQSQQESSRERFIQNILDLVRGLQGSSPDIPAGKSQEDRPAKGLYEDLYEGIYETLSERELEILQLIGEGYSNQEIAEQLVVTLHTVKKHSSNIYGKLGVTSRTRAVAEARRLKLI